MKIFSTKQFYEADAMTIRKQKVTSTELMERAGVECFNWLHGKMGGAQVPIHVFCGIGNNGGDGLVIARLLFTHDYNVTVYIANFTDKRSHDFLVNYNLYKELNNDWPVLMTSEENFPEIDKDDIIIDALFGIGLNRPLEGWVKKLIQFLNKSEAFTLAIDIPSGLYPNKALVASEGVLKADHTLTFQHPKLCFFLPQTAGFSDSFDVVDIGLDQEFLGSEEPIAYTFSRYDAQRLYKTRHKFDHKGTYGHSLIVGGSYGKIGATILASKAALKIGAGMVSTYIPKCGYGILQSAFPEAMVITDTANKTIGTIKIDFKPSAIGLGMGIGTKKKTHAALKEFLSTIDSPLVIDADALNCISENEELLRLVPKGSILTPHPGELRRLLGDWTDDYQKINLAKAFSEKHHLLLVIKGAHTLIINKDEVFINTTGNPGMATAGSGDVLAGMITGLLSQGYASLNAVLLGVYLHGSAGDIAAGYLGFESVIASDIINAIGSAYLDLFTEDTKEAAVEE